MYFFLAKTNQVDNSQLLQTLIVWGQNMSRLPPITTCFFLTCTHLAATDSITKIGFVTLDSLRDSDKLCILLKGFV